MHILWISVHIQDLSFLLDHKLPQRWDLVLFIWIMFGTGSLQNFSATGVTSRNERRRVLSQYVESQLSKQTWVACPQAIHQVQVKCHSGLKALPDIFSWKWNLSHPGFPTRSVNAAHQTFPLLLLDTWLDCTSWAPLESSVVTCLARATKWEQKSFVSLLSVNFPSQWEIHYTFFLLPQQLWKHRDGASFWLKFLSEDIIEQNISADPW